MKLNGWQRLWVFASVLMAGAAVFEAFDGYPDRKWIDAEYMVEMRSLTPGQLERERELAKGNRYSELMGELTPIPVALAERKQMAQDKYETDLKALPGRQRGHLIEVFLAWCAASVGLYTLGWFIAWIRRGFKSDKSENQGRL